MTPTPPRAGATLFGYFRRLGHAKLALLVVLGTAAAAGSALQIAMTSKIVASGMQDVGPFVAGWAATFIAMVAIDIAVGRMVSSSTMQIRLDITRRIMSAPLRTTEKAGTSQLLSVLTEDVTALSAAMSSIPTIGTSVLTVLGGFAYLVVVSPALALVHTAAAAAAVLATMIPFRRALATGRMMTLLQQGMIERFRYVVEGTKELKLDQARRRWNAFHALPTQAKELRDRHRTVIAYIALVGGMSRVFAFAVVGTTSFVGRAYLGATTAELATFAISTFFLLGPIEGIIARAPTIASAQAALARIERIGVALSSEEEDERQTDSYRTAFRTIEMDGVTFGYEKGGFQVGPFDFVLERGQIVFIVGGNGSGKSTFAKLLCGLYRPDGGKVLVDDEPVGDGNRDAYRQLFTSVFGDFCLFPEITGTDEPIERDKADELLASLGLRGKVDVAGGRFSTTDLSTGQRKRLALVAAYLRDSSVFVFDEWAADQDPAFRKIFYRHIIPELRANGKTVIAITHDEAYFDAADVLVKMEEGRIVNEPTRLFMARLTGTKPS